MPCCFFADHDVRTYNDVITSAGTGLFEPGLSGMPAVFAAYKAIGAEIISGNQSDIDFAQFGLH